ncbi:MAG: hypothetical protein LLG42_00865 [Chloroflexi bacterium]|jgi:hypothetical protein|nr:hypothetical protein [Chloroflexota bacterium]
MQDAFATRDPGASRSKVGEYAVCCGEGTIQIDPPLVDLPMIHKAVAGAGYIKRPRKRILPDSNCPFASKHIPASSDCVWDRPRGGAVYGRLRRMAEVVWKSYRVCALADRSYVGNPIWLSGFQEHGYRQPAARAAGVKDD